MLRITVLFYVVKFKNLGSDKFLTDQEANSLIFGLFEKCPLTQTYIDTAKSWDEKEINAYAAWKAYQTEENNKEPTKKELEGVFTSV